MWPSNSSTAFVANYTLSSMQCYIWSTYVLCTAYVAQDVQPLQFYICSKYVLCTAIIAHHWKMHLVIASILCFWDAVCEGELLPARKLPGAEKSNNIALQYFDSEESQKVSLIEHGQDKILKKWLTPHFHSTKGNNASKIWFLYGPPHCNRKDKLQVA